MSLVIDEHRQYLADRHRLAAYERAIGEVVRPGHRVLDLGAGTGILGLLACRAGAARVYAVEVTGLSGLAREVAHANDLGDRIVHIREHSRHVTLPERVDVVICDQVGRFGFDAGIVEDLDDARARLLEPAGRLVPSAIELWVAPVDCPDGFADVEFWTTRPCGWDVSPARAFAVNTGYPRHLRVEELLASGAMAGRIDLARQSPRPLRFGARLPVQRRGTLHGIGGWFTARLSNTVSMTNSPLVDGRINRRNVFLPIERPIPVDVGDEVRVSLQILPEDSVLVWRVMVQSAGVEAPPRARFTHSTWRAMLFGRVDLQRTQPDHRPRLSGRGRARLSVLELTDGSHTIAAIEREVQRRHPDLFRTAEEAAVFVAEVITRYAE